MVNSPSTKTQVPILCIAGPTASGKSALALQWAQRQQQAGTSVEIICVDSATIYRGMDIGTAKPSCEDRACVPHHLLDIQDPSQAYSAASFMQDATHCIAQIQARGHTPLLVGGTMLYFQALMIGMDDLPKTNAAVRADLQAQALAQGWPALHARLAQIDPVTAARLAPNDAQRIGRALEVFHASGQPLSAHFRSAPPTANPSYRMVALGLQEPPRPVLHERIAARFHQMLNEGLVEEVRTLKAREDLSPMQHPSMRCVGYRQIWEYLEGGCTYPEMVERGIAATRQLAKRQLTWLRGWRACEVITHLPMGDDHHRFKV